MLFEKAVSPSRPKGVFVPDLSDKSGPGAVDFCLVDFGEFSSVVSIRGGLGGITAVNLFATVTVLHELHARKG